MMNWFDNRARVSAMPGVSALLTSVGSSNSRRSLYAWRLWPLRPSSRPPWTPATSICWSSPQPATPRGSSTPTGTTTAGTAAEERAGDTAAAGGSSDECTDVAIDGAACSAPKDRSPGERQPRSQQEGLHDSGSGDHPAVGFADYTHRRGCSIVDSRPDYRTEQSSESGFHRQQLEQQQQQQQQQRQHQQQRRRQPQQQLQKQQQQQVNTKVLNGLTQQTPIGPSRPNNLGRTRIHCGQEDFAPSPVSQADQDAMERIERLRQSLFLRSDVMLTGNCLSALCFILGMVMLGVHSFIEERADFMSVVELHNVPTTQISCILILLSTIVPAGERLQRLYIARLEKQLDNAVDVQ